MGFFSRKKRNTQATGRIKISGNTLICKGREGASPLLHDDKIAINTIQNIYWVRNKYGRSSLSLLNEEGYHSLPASFTGFAKVFDFLAQQYGFDEKRYNSLLQQKKPLKQCLWRKIYPCAYTILKTNYNDYAAGFEIQSPQKKFISWDMPLRELTAIPEVMLTSAGNGAKILSFRYPVRVGVIVFNNPKAQIYNNRKDVPVLNFYVGCYNEANNSDSYVQLKSVLEKQLKHDHSDGYKRKDQWHWHFEAEHIGFELTYWFDSEYSFESCYTSFT